MRGAAFLYLVSEREEKRSGKSKKLRHFFAVSVDMSQQNGSGSVRRARQWNTFVEEPIASKLSAKGISAVRKESTYKDNNPVSLKEINSEEKERTSTGIGELDRVLGGGIVQGSLVLVGGDPGIGKSTLLLQMCYYLSDAGNKVLYISGEESLRQIKLRAERIGECNDNLKTFCETNLDIIEEVLKKEMPQVVIIDSIQTMYREEISAAPGSVSQVRESTSILMQLAKGLNITIFIVGHVTKEGVVAGPRVLEHMVDTVLYFEGDRYASYRILRSVKNRFGSTNEIGAVRDEAGRFK